MAARSWSASGGDLVALGQGTAECQSITVPGFGHADRIAEDKTNDLALLRLYGARNLAAAPAWRPGGGTAGPLTLVRYRRPLGAAGGAAVTARHRAAHRRKGCSRRQNLDFPARRRSTLKAGLPAWLPCKAPVIAGARTVCAAGNPGARRQRCVPFSPPWHHTRRRRRDRAIRGAGYLRAKVTASVTCSRTWPAASATKAAMPSFWSAVANSE